MNRNDKPIFRTTAEKIREFEEIQMKLKKDIKFQSVDISSIQYVAGIDVAYCEHNQIEYGCCSIVVIDFNTLEIVEKVSGIEVITEEYIPGFFAFRELPIILNTVKKLTISPDIFVFDGNGYLHPNNMGIATHASFYLKKPCIGVSKTYFVIDNIDLIMPSNELGASTLIKKNSEILGATMRTKVNAKPIYISCGNFITLENCKDIIKKFITKDSRIPMPTRLADLETHKIKNNFLISIRNKKNGTIK